MKLIISAAVAAIILIGAPPLVAAWHVAQYEEKLVETAARMALYQAGTANHFAYMEALAAHNSLILKERQRLASVVTVRFF
jgi:hypothetical protein